MVHSLTEDKRAGSNYQSAVRRSTLHAWRPRARHALQLLKVHVRESRRMDVGGTLSSRGELASSAEEVGGVISRRVGYQGRPEWH